MELRDIMGAGDKSPAIFSTFNVMPIGVAWRESTSNGPRPPSRCAVVPPWRNVEKTRVRRRAMANAPLNLDYVLLTSKTPYVAIDERGLVRSIPFLFSCVH